MDFETSWHEIKSKCESKALYWGASQIFTMI